MTNGLVERIKRFQTYLLEVGVARGVIALPAPRMLALPSPSEESSGSANAFVRLVTEPEIAEVSRDLYMSGHYSVAVQEAFKAVEKFVQTKANIHTISGVQLMEHVFSPHTPRLYWSSRRTISEQDEQKGYHRLYSGAMLGIRNPTTHEFRWVEEPEVALELVMFAQHLLRKAKIACDISALADAEDTRSLT